jgi:hypothetical protein
MTHEVVTKQQVWRDASGVRTKEAELANTYDMPQSVAPKDKTPSKGELAVINKTASAEEDELLKLAFDANLEVNEQPVKGENPKAAPQTSLKPRVNVTGKDAPQVLHEKKASYYALPFEERYPLDTIPQVVKAASYFDETGVLMTPVMRHEYCQNMVKRAHALGLPVSDIAERYGSDTYATPEQIKIALDARRSILTSPLAETLLDKVAEALPKVGPEDFAVLLSEFDKMACIDEFWGGDVPDPYFSTFGKSASAQVSTTDPEASIIVGNEYTTERKLVELATKKHGMVCEVFGKDFAKEFGKDPRAIFDSMPHDQKLVLMRMANNSDSTTFGASTS